MAIFYNGARGESIFKKKLFLKPLAKNAMCFFADGMAQAQ